MILSSLKKHALNLVRRLQERASPNQMLLLGFGSTWVGYNGSAVIHVEPLAAFRPSTIHIPEDIASNFVVTNITVGVIGGSQTSFMNSTGGIPASAFVRGLPFNIGLVCPSQFISISVTNTSHLSQKFGAVIIGSSALQ